MNKRRLLKLADLLEANAKNKKGMKFDFNVLGTAGGEEGWYVEHNPPLKELKLDCGTTGCAMGLAAISGKFKRAGLSYKLDGNSITCTVNRRSVDYEHAATRIFDIGRAEATFLFTPSEGEEHTGAAGERFIARRIRNFVAGKVGPDLNGV